MKSKQVYKFFFLYIFIVFLQKELLSQNYPDQFYIIQSGDSLFNCIEANSGIKLSDDHKSLILEDSVVTGYLILKPQTSVNPFNRGLPSWNGTASDKNCGFKIQMRFPYGNGWSAWLTVGFWKEYIWGSYGSTSFGGGKIDIDYVKLTSYQSSWQFKIILLRKSLDLPSPSLHKLSFFISDSRTDKYDFNAVLNDKPPAILIPTDFLYQYGIDSEIGGSICSPTTVSMILRSYNIDVDPLQFARDTQDPYFDIFGVWPRVVQNAVEYGLNGAVTRYRNWSDAYEVLANGGRIAMSVGEPLYEGHLMMLAGFTSSGNPIVHDPARSSGYSYQFNKSDLSHSWFDKGGIAYTFYPADSGFIPTYQHEDFVLIPGEFQLYQNYPNPFNSNTIITYYVPEQSFVDIRIFDILGREVQTLVSEYKSPGKYSASFSAAGDLSSGVYFYKLSAGNNTTIKKMNYLK